jgi:hypothetical protein
MSIKVTVEGLDQVKSSLTSYVNGKRKAITDQTNKSLINIRRETVRNLVKQLEQSGGRLASSYHITKFDLAGEVFSNLEYAPFVEFGTGEDVFINDKGFTFDSDVRQYASQFKRGPGRNKEAKPHLFPAFEEERPKYVQAIEKIL